MLTELAYVSFPSRARINNLIRRYAHYRLSR